MRGLVIMRGTRLKLKPFLIEIYFYEKFLLKNIYLPGGLEFELSEESV